MAALHEIDFGRSLIFRGLELQTQPDPISHPFPESLHTKGGPYVAQKVSQVSRTGCSSRRFPCGKRDHDGRERCDER